MKEDEYIKTKVKIAERSRTRDEIGEIQIKEAVLMFGFAIPFIIFGFIKEDEFIRNVGFAITGISTLVGFLGGYNLFYADSTPSEYQLLAEKLKEEENRGL